MISAIPVQASDRIPVLDELRGFALLGIMFVNMTWFTGFAVLAPEARAGLGTANIDRIAYWFIHVLVDGKFWSLFALLFGVGVAYQHKWAQSTGADFTSTYLKRVCVLFVAGMAHATLLWFGDIVSLYAVVGLVLLLFVHRSPRTTLIWSCILLLAPVVQLAGILIIHELQSNGIATDPGLGPAEMFRSFSQGTYLDVLIANWEFLKERWIIAFYDGRFMKLAGMFLLGWWLGNKNLFRVSLHSKRFWKFVLATGLLVGLPLNVIAYSFFEGVFLRPPSLDGWIVETIKSLATPTLCLAYVGAITLANFSRQSRIGVSNLLATAGRMSLTNYIAQSLIGVVIFYGYGFGNWGQVGAALSIPLIIAIFGAQICFSCYWLKYFRQGPLEWICRCFTYQQLLPLRIETPHKQLQGTTKVRNS